MRAARQNREPAPENRFIAKNFDVSRDADQGGLQCFTRNILVAGGDDQQVAPQAVEVSVVKSALGHFISFRHCAGQRGDIRRFARTVVRGR